MSQRITLYVRVRLLSDTIFGAGFSVPGGEDIAVCEDSKGYGDAGEGQSKTAACPSERTSVSRVLRVAEPQCRKCVGLPTGRGAECGPRGA